MSVKRLDWGKCDWTNLKPTLAQKVYQGGSNCTITMSVIQPKHVPGPHVHEYEQVVMILKGKCNFHVGDEVIAFDADMENDGAVGLLTVPPNVVHWIDNPYDEPVYNLDIFYPKRTEDREESVEVR